ncbi:MAG: PIN domain-containing protein [Chloroflexi bacterium CFX4]|nr:PIN domain-containing protein [Chloroflexi bacterium CFX4]MDL1923168.1 PIN domain-containing protein [Chloroflexi bacterium CFX3]
MISVSNAVFVDTNILISAYLNAAPRHVQALHALTSLAQQRTALWISRQVLREFAVNLTRSQPYATRPPSVRQVTAAIRYFQEHFFVADDNQDVTGHLLSLMEHITAGGKQVHDANIVAMMLANQIQRLLTFNVADFSRFAQYVTLLPIETLAPPNNAP